MSAEYGLPEVFDPVLDYVASLLPPPADQLVDRVLVPLLARGWALGQSLYALAAYMLGTDPSSWDAQQILPPLITLLGAYLAIISFYRTTSWMVRTSIWFVKWGSILGALAGGAGYLAGQQANGRGLDLHGGVTGLAHSVGGIVWDLINSPSAPTGGQAGRTSKKRTSKRRSQRAKKGTSGSGAAPANEAPKAKPGAWDSFDSHRAYKATQDQKPLGNPSYDEDLEDSDASPILDSKKIVTQIVGFAGRMGWLDAVKDAVETVAKDLASKTAEEVTGGKEESGSSTDKKKKEKASR